MEDDCKILRMTATQYISASRRVHGCRACAERTEDLTIQLPCDTHVAIRV